MKTSSTIVVAIVAAALGAYGYSLLAPAGVAHTEHAADKKPEKPNDHVEQDEHGADRIRISDVKLAAAGVTLAEAGSATLTDTLSFNGILRANQEAVVQVTPRFPGVAKSIQKRIGDRVGKDDLLAAIESNQSLTVYELKAPIAGTIIERQISLGEYASEQKPAFVVADLSTIWVDLSIYRQDLRRVRLNDEVLIDPDDGRGEIKGTISYMAPIGSSETQTALARVVLPNPDGRLASRPVRHGAADPRRAQRRGRRTPKRDPDAGEQDHRVRPRGRRQDRGASRSSSATSDPRHVEIKAGLSAGEHYVAENSFVVKAEMGKGEAEHDWAEGAAPVQIAEARHRHRADVVEGRAEDGRHGEGGAQRVAVGQRRQQVLVGRRQPRRDAVGVAPVPEAVGRQDQILRQDALDRRRHLGRARRRRLERRRRVGHLAGELALRSRRRRRCDGRAGAAGTRGGSARAAAAAAARGSARRRCA